VISFEAARRDVLLAKSTWGDQPRSENPAKATRVPKTGGVASRGWMRPKDPL